MSILILIIDHAIHANLNLTSDMPRARAHATVRPRPRHTNKTINKKEPTHNTQQRDLEGGGPKIWRD
jgi:hypothetical protein